MFKDQFRAGRYFGFCLYDDEFPIIYVNNTAAKVRQIFTLFHELAHLLFHTSGIDVTGDDYLSSLRGEAKRIEVICNRFAGEFLVPADAFDALIHRQERNEETARALAAEFNVSWLVIYRRFYDRQWISKQAYEGALATQANRPEGGTGGNYYNNQMAYLGRDFIGMALREFYQDRISEAQLADYLNVAPKNISGIEERFLRGQA